MRDVLLYTGCENVMRAYLLSAQLLTRGAIKSLILRGDNIAHLMLMELEGVHMLLELEVWWAFFHTALIVLKQVLVMLDLSLTCLLDMRRKLGNNGQSSIDCWQSVWIHVM